MNGIVSLICWYSVVNQGVSVCTYYNVCVWFFSYLLMINTYAPLSFDIVQQYYFYYNYVNTHFIWTLYIYIGETYNTTYYVDYFIVNDVTHSCYYMLCLPVSVILFYVFSVVVWLFLEILYRKISDRKNKSCNDNIYSFLCYST